jgi:hypothetical protein
MDALKAANSDLPGSFASKMQLGDMNYKYKFFLRINAHKIWP